MIERLIDLSAQRGRVLEGLAQIAVSVCEADRAGLVLIEGAEDALVPLAGGKPPRAVASLLKACPAADRRHGHLLSGKADQKPCLVLPIGGDAAPCATALWVEGARRDADEARLAPLAAQAQSILDYQTVNEQLIQQEVLRNQAAKLAKVGSWQVDLTTYQVAWCREMYDIYEIDPSGPPPDIEGFMHRIVHEEDRAWTVKNMTSLDEPICERVFQISRPGGGTRWVRAIREIEVVGGRPVRIFGSVQDVTELQEAQGEVERLAFTDSLTGLPNRAHFTRELERLTDSQEPTGLLMVDLDHFKEINDTLGHDAGDALLCDVADRLRRAFRSHDIVARLGGDEFAVILPGAKQPEHLTRPTAVLEKLLQAPVTHGEQMFHIGASIGGALFPSQAESVAELLKNADIALYAAKEAGRGRMIPFESEMAAEARRRTHVLREVREGLEKGEFQLYYQPLVSLGDQQVTSFEALMRWHHPRKGLLDPSAFGDAFEDRHLAPALRDFGFESAFKQMRAWLDQGVDFGRIAINLSAAQFRAPDLAGWIEARLRHWGLHPQHLTIEVNENVYMGWGADIVGNCLNQLHEAGVLVAVDDFGTGYASLATLKTLPIDRLKIDKSFIQESADQPIVEAVIKMGASLGIPVVAEGVERPDQLEFLAEHGCNQVQGFHLARPMPPEEVPGFLKQAQALRRASAA